VQIAGNKRQRRTFVKFKIIVVIAVIIAAFIICSNKEIRKSVVTSVKPHMVELFGTQEDKVYFAIDQFYQMMRLENTAKLSELICEENRDKVLSELQPVFSYNDLKYVIVSRKISKITGNHVEVALTLDTTRISGGRYRNKREKGILTMRLVEGKWLFDNFDVRKVIYLV
jgi:hypothetical protein